jgi:hypothetical protein
MQSLVTFAMEYPANALVLESNGQVQVFVESPNEKNGLMLPGMGPMPGMAGAQPFP